MRVILDVRVILSQDTAEEFMLRVVYRLDNETIVAREVKEGTGLARATKLGENVFCGEREKVVGRVESKVIFTQLPKNPWRVVLELEVILRRRSELVSNTKLRISGVM